MKIEDYGIIGDMHTVALVGNNGSIDWLCVPRFGSDACFAALLGEESNGFWRIAPPRPSSASGAPTASRRSSLKPNSPPRPAASG